MIRLIAATGDDDLSLVQLSFHGILGVHLDEADLRAWFVVSDLSPESLCITTKTREWVDDSLVVDTRTSVSLVVV